MRSLRKLYLSFFFSFLFTLPSTGQNNPDSLYFMQTLTRGDACYNRNAYDSAFTIYKQAFEWASEKKMLNYYAASGSLLFMGHCLLNREQLQGAHEYYYKALKNARLYNHHRELKNTALRQLNYIQNHIQEFDKKFEYPAHPVYTEKPVYFSIDSIFYQKGDSALVQINAGLYDGVIPEKNQGAGLHSLTDSKTNKGGDYSGTVRVISLTNNKTMAMVKLQNNLSVQHGWQVKLTANVPDNVMLSSLKDSYLLNFNWVANDRSANLFSRRFLYYFGDNELYRDVADLLRIELNDVITRFASDTLKAENILGQPIEDGIFKGKNIIRALKESTGNTIRYFIRFMSDYYSSYSGQRFRFSETYATWVKYKAPLNKEDIQKFILGDESVSGDMIRRAGFVSNQAEEKNMPDRWVDEGLELIDKGHWTPLLSQSRLLYHYGVATGRKDCLGWSNFFDAVRLKTFGHVAKCDSFLKAAYLNFRQANSAEGMQWVQSAGSSLLDTTAINLNVQSSHILNYTLYPSPNKRYFATGSDDMTIKIWDIQLGKQIRTIQGHNKEVVRLAYNPGGRYLASLSEDSTIKIWNTYNYKEMFSFKPANEQRTIKFSPDGKHIVSCGYDSTVNFWDPFTGKLNRSFHSPSGYVRDFAFNPVLPNTLYLVCTDSALYAWKLDSNSFKREMKTDNILVNFFFSDDGAYSCYQKNDSSISIISMESGKIVYTGKVYTSGTLTGSYFSDGCFSPDSRYFIYCGKDSNTVIVNLQQWKSLVLQGGLARQKAFNSDGSFYITQNGGNPAIVDFSDFNWDKVYKGIYGESEFEEWFEVYKQLQEKEFKNESAPILETKFSADDKSLYYISWGTHRLDFSNGKSDLLAFAHHWMGGRHQYPENEDIVVYREFKVDDTLIVYDVKKNRKLGMLTIPGGEKISSFAFFDKDKFCLLGGAKGSIACWDMEQNKLRYHIPRLNGSDQGISSLLTQPGTQKIIAFGSKIKPVIIEGANGTLLQKIDVESTGLAAFANGKIFFGADSGRIYYTDTISYIVRMMDGLNMGTGYFEDFKGSYTGKYLYVLNEPYCFIIDAQSLQLVNSFMLTGTNLGNLSVSHNDSLLAIGSFNGHLTLIRPLTGKMIGKIYFPFANDCILTDSMGHYLASKKALQAVVFNYGHKSFNYDQFDLQLNQPHKVLAAFGVTDSITLQAYEKAYKKRLQRNGLSDASMTEGRIPSIAILNSAGLRPTTSQEFYTITAQFYDFKHKLSSVKVFVNDVPVPDSAGEWSSLDTVSQTFNIKLPLTHGKNRIKLYCVNQLGLSSYKEIFDIYCTAKRQKQTTYFIGLGVNQYADAANNLIYSAKDIRDLVRRFKIMYPDLVIDTLINKQVTLKNIELLKQRLKKIRVTDRVIMAVTGHGILSDSLDFYYATYDVNFKKPELKGLKYEDLENIMNATAARQKLLLIDACHSGMVDKETVAGAKNQGFHTDSSAVTAKIPGAKGLIAGHTTQLGETNSFNLMRNLFADFSNDNGIIVISAAGGLEYAYESGQWRNGVFTYCILKGLEEKEPDKRTEGGDEDGKISVQELMRYVSKKVPELTNGNQQPTSRRENLDYDWIIK